MIQRNASTRAILVVAVLAALSQPSLPANAQGSGPSASEPPLSPGFRFVETSGEQLFASVCQGCHMSDARGAIGAGTYPSLAGNRNLEAGGYPLAIVVNGQRGMPAFGPMMSDDQVAAVVNYLRTHFDNNYKDAVTAEDVRSARR